MVISTGMTVPRRFSVWALYCCTKSMVLTPWGPSAVPTGGAGVAAPAGSWIFTMALTFFLATTFLSTSSRTTIGARLRREPKPPKGLELGHLGELQLHGRLPTEDVDEHLELELVLVDLGDGPGEVGERPFLDAHALADLVLQAGPALLGGFLAWGRDLQERLDLFARQRRRLGSRS